jgi:hypothetical protein
VIYTVKQDLVNMVKGDLAIIDPAPEPFILNSDSPRDYDISQQKSSSHPPEIKDIVQRGFDNSPIESKYSLPGRETSLEGQFNIKTSRENPPIPNQTLVSKSNSIRASLAHSTPGPQVTLRKYIVHKTYDEKKSHNLKQG